MSHEDKLKIENERPEKAGGRAWKKEFCLYLWNQMWLLWAYLKQQQNYH